MRKLLKSMKTLLLVAAGLCVGTNSAWAGTTPLLDIDYSTVTTPAWIVQGGTGTIANEAWVHAQGGGSGARSAYLDFGVNSSIDDNWAASFEVTTTTGSTYTNSNTQIQMAFTVDEASYTQNALCPTASVLFGARYQTSSTNPGNSIPYIITLNGVDEAETVTLAHGTKYTFNVAVNGTSLTASIMNGNTTVYSGSTTLDAFVKPRGIYDLLPRPYNAGWGVYSNTYDNIRVTKEVDVEIMTDPNISVAYSGATRTVTITEGSSSDGNAVTTYYTTDGSDPTSESDVYSAPLEISSDCTIKVVSISSTGLSSEIVSESITVGKITLNAPTISLSAFTLNNSLYNPTYTFTSDQSTIEGSPDVTYTYTFNGGNDTEGTSYTATAGGSITVTVSAENYTSNSTTQTIDGGYFYKSYSFDAINDVTVDATTGTWDTQTNVSGAQWTFTSLENCTYTLRADISLSSNFRYARATTAQSKQGFYTRTGSGTVNFTLASGEYILFNTLNNIKVIASSAATSQSFAQYTNVRAMEIYTPTPTTFTLASDNAQHVTFHNAGSGAANDDNYKFNVYNGGEKVGEVRADWWCNVAGGNGNFTNPYLYSADGGITNAGDINWGTFCSDSQDADCDFTVSYTNGSLYIIGTMTKGNDIYYVNYTKTGLTGDVAVYLYGKNATLSNIATSSTDVNTTYVGPSNAVTAEISDAGAATFVCNYALDFTNVEGLQAYIATAQNGASITFDKVTGAVPANTPLLLRGTTADIPVAASAEAVGTNLLVAGTGAAVASEDNGKYNFILNKVDDVVGFYKAAGQTVASNRAYLSLSENPFAGGATAKSVTMIFNGEMTGITTVAAPASKAAVKGTYNMQGQRVQNPSKGLYIVDGKKVAIN